MAKLPPRCFRLEATRGPHTGSTRCLCSASSLPSFISLPLSIGRKKCCWLRLPKDLEVSSVHAEFRFVETGENERRLTLCDVKSTNGTKVNRKPLQAQRDYPLSDGDLITVGRTSLRFLQVGHGQSCEEEEVYRASITKAHTELTPSVASSLMIQSGATPVVVELDEEEEAGAPAMSPIAPAFAGTSHNICTCVELSDIPVDEPDNEPDDGEVKSVKDVMLVGRDMDSSRKEEGDDVTLMATAKSRGINAGVVDDTSEEATRTTCSEVIGRHDMLKQQAHLNKCIADRVTVITADVAEPVTVSAVSNTANPKARKRKNAGNGATCAKKPRKLKANGVGDNSCTVATKAKRPRKRKRIDVGGDIALALGLAGTIKMDKEQQTDLQLGVTKKKIEDLDEQMAKLAKRRVNLVRTLSRLERTKEMLRKSQVLPPAKVLQLLDLKAALNVIFPSNRQVHPWDQRLNKKQGAYCSVVATRYAPSRWTEIRNNGHDEEKRAELAAVAAISMWKRASQSLFGLQCESLLYRNSVLRAFLRGDEDAECGSINMDYNYNLDIEDPDSIIKCEAEYDRISELVPVLSDHVLDLKVPDVVKRVFPNWQRDLAFLQDQPADDIKMALEAMNDAQAESDALLVNSNELDEREDLRARTSPGQIITGSDAPINGQNRQEQRLACKFMAQVMLLLIEKKTQRRINARELKPQQAAMDQVDCNAEKCQHSEQQSVVVNENEAAEEPHDPTWDKIPKASTLKCG